jgi:hypothetical protein
LRFRSYSYLIHNLIRTRFLVSGEKWSKKTRRLTVTKSRICYELSGKIIPDTWILFEENTTEGVYEQPLILEIDRGMEYQQKFKNHVRERLEFVASGEYAQLFQTEGVTILYATTGQTPEYRESRRKSLCQWTMEVLQEQKIERWAEVFLFASVVREEMYTHSLFDDPVWYRPDCSEPFYLF